jgi:hypothetical protein
MKRNGLCSQSLLLEDRTEVAIRGEHAACLLAVLSFPRRRETSEFATSWAKDWVPACAGMTNPEKSRDLLGLVILTHCRDFVSHFFDERLWLQHGRGRAETQHPAHE